MKAILMDTKDVTLSDRDIFCIYFCGLLGYKENEEEQEDRHLQIVLWAL